MPEIGKPSVCSRVVQLVCLMRFACPARLFLWELKRTYTCEHGSADTKTCSCTTKRQMTANFTTLWLYNCNVK